MLLAMINNKAVTFDSMTDFIDATWSPENEYTFLTDFHIRGKNYASRKNYARNLAKEVQQVTSNGNLSWGEIANITSMMESIARYYGLQKEFRENGII